MPAVRIRKQNFPQGSPKCVEQDTATNDTDQELARRERRGSPEIIFDNAVLQHQVDFVYRC